MKRITALLMVVLTVFSVFSIAVAAEEPTTKWYQYTPEECKHNSMIPGDRYYGPEYYFKGSDTCFLCGFVCEHPADKRVYYADVTTSKYDSYDYNSKAHMKLYKCEYCCKSSIVDESTAAKHKYTRTKDSIYNDYHTATCKVCDYTVTNKCNYKTTYKKSSSDTHHKVIKTCTICKQKGYIAKDSQKHSYKDNKCTKCGFVRVVPGTVKISTAKNTAKGKKRTVNVDGKWVYSNGEYIWKKPYKYTVYDYKISLKFSSKNAVKYIVTNAADKDLDDGHKNRIVTKKKEFTYTYTSSRKKASKVTLYITPISKTGTYGKTVKKTITLKN